MKISTGRTTPYFNFALISVASFFLGILFFLVFHLGLGAIDGVSQSVSMSTAVDRVEPAAAMVAASLGLAVSFAGALVAINLAQRAVDQGEETRQITKNTLKSEVYKIVAADIEKANHAVTKVAIAINELLHCYREVRNSATWVDQTLKAEEHQKSPFYNKTQEKLQDNEIEELAKEIGSRLVNPNLNYSLSRDKRGVLLEERDGIVSEYEKAVEKFNIARESFSKSFLEMSSNRMVANSNVRDGSDATSTLWALEELLASWEASYPSLRRDFSNSVSSIVNLLDFRSNSSFLVPDSEPFKNLHNQIASDILSTSTDEYYYLPTFDNILVASFGGPATQETFATVYCLPLADPVSDVFTHDGTVLCDILRLGSLLYIEEVRPQGKTWKRYVANTRKPDQGSTMDWYANFGAAAIFEVLNSIPTEIELHRSILASLKVTYAELFTESELANISAVVKGLISSQYVRPSVGGASIDEIVGNVSPERLITSSICSALVD